MPCGECETGSRETRRAKRLCCLSFYPLDIFAADVNLGEIKLSTIADEARPVHAQSSIIEYLSRIYYYIYFQLFIIN